MNQEKTWSRRELRAQGRCSRSSSASYVVRTVSDCDSRRGTAGETQGCGTGGGAGTAWLYERSQAMGGAAGLGEDPPSWRAGPGSGGAQHNPPDMPPRRDKASAEQVEGCILQSPGCLVGREKTYMLTPRRNYLQKHFSLNTLHNSNRRSSLHFMPR